LKKARKINDNDWLILEVQKGEEQKLNFDVKSFIF